MNRMLNLEEPAGAPTARFALWELGFRPFYLLASTFAAVSVLLWTLQMTGVLRQPYLAGPVWHAHEMLFGFTLAVIVGFLFTAGRNWTGRPTPTGASLAALAGLWLAGRVLVLTPFGWAAALVNAAFPAAAAIALAIPFIAARNKRNYFFIALLLALSVAALGIHLAQLGTVTLPAWAGIRLALDVVLFILCVMGGRVIPMFTNNGVPGANAQRFAWLDWSSLALVLWVLGADLVRAPTQVLVVLGALAALAHALRWAFWKPWRTWRKPLVWVLHVAYFWIPAHLVLRTLAALEWTTASLADHALTVGAVGGLIIGMMTRTARGHTARPLTADGWDVACYALVLLAAVLRVALPLAAPATYPIAVLLSGLLWSAGFGLYTVRYWSVLTRARLDGQPG
jgi:uncharacterized protein involved in response to NO